MRILYVLLLLAAAAVVVDNPARWHEGAGMLRHADWDGVLPADLVTAVFLFFLGAAIPLYRRTPRAPALFAIAALLCAAGLAINGLARANVPTWRIPGVLQRAGILLAVAAVAKALVTGDYRRRIAVFGSAAAAITIAYWLIMAHVAAPGGAPGDLLPSDNPAAWLDRLVLGRHAWSEHWDPDGILSTLSSVSTVLGGLAAGVLLTSGPRGTRRALELAGAGAAAIFTGVVWTPMVAMNRTLWSGSFVVFSGGVAAVLLALLEWTERR
jgi:predicted acyltransferase